MKKRNYWIAFLNIGMIFSAIADVTIVDTQSTTINGSLTHAHSLNVTSGEMVVVMGSFDGYSDGALNNPGTVSATFGETPMTPLVESFRSDGEVASAIFYLMNPSTGSHTVSMPFPGPRAR